MKKIILCFILTLLFSSVISQNKDLNSFDFNEMVIEKYKYDFSKIIDLDDRISFINSIIKNLQQKKINEAEIINLINKIISKDFFVKSEMITFDQIIVLNNIYFPVPIDLKVLNVYFQNNSRLRLVCSFIIYNEDDKLIDKFYYLGYKHVAFIDDNKYLIYNYSLGQGYNEQGIVDLINKTKYYNSYGGMMSIGFSSNDYFVKLPNTKIIDKSIKDRLINKFKIYKYLMNGMLGVQYLYPWNLNSK
jgi:hypothetical protein